MKKNYIGLSITGHDPAIAIMNNEGEVVFAEAAERYLQNKRAWNCPADDLVRCATLINSYCEQDAQLVMAASWKRVSAIKFAFYNLINALYANHPFHIQLVMRSLISGLKANSDSAGINLLLQAKWHGWQVEQPLRYYSHHLVHAASACYASPFNEAACFVADGMGENTAISSFHYQQGKLQALDGFRPVNQYSLGFFYSIVCNACGFDFFQGEEWKVMGLASYGKFDENLYKLFKRLITFHKGYVVMPRGAKKALWEIKALQRQPEQSALIFADFAYTAQYYFCELLIALLNSLYTRKPSENLVFTGGCALNSSANGLILENTPFKNLFIPSAPSDDGNAIGAAYLAFKQDNPEFVPSTTLLKPYLGSTINQKTLERFIEYGPYKPSELNGKAISVKTAELLAQGKLIAWVQDCAEYGPRALGNRSILADPRTENVKDKLNITVKFREEFRPFAPSILHEYGGEYFENYQESPYMERTLKFKPDVKAKVPGVVHVDGSGRLQTVKREWNAKYYDLIAEFHKLTGIPILLNTSFNVMGKPIIHSVEDAFTVFNSSGLDALVINDLLFEKQP